MYGQISSRLDKIEQPELKKEKIVVNQEAPKMTGYKTYVLFGIDTRGEGSQYSAQNSDTMIIVSVNNDTKEVRMVSVYRDTLLNVGDDTYTKANAAYALGGPEQAITMLNTNLDLDISDYATADFSALVEVVDDLGGLDIPLSYAEIEHMNNYCVETSKLTGKDYTPIEKPEPKPEDEEAIVGTYHLNGVQATSYCRIRYTASLDMGRTERQRRVLGMLFDKAKIAGLSSIFKIMDDVFPMVTTSLSKQDILGLIPTLIGYKFTDSTGFPQKFKFSNIKGSIIVPTDLENNVVELHKFLYDDQDYTPSSEVVARSNKILEIVGGEGKLDDADKTTTQDTDTTNANDTFVWSGDNTSGSTDNSGDYDSDYDNGGYDVGQKYRNKTRVIFQKRLRRNFDLLFRAEIAGKEQEQRNAGHEHNADERHQVHAFADDRLIVVFDFEKKMYARDLNESDNSREIKSDVALRTGNRHFSSPPRLYVIEGGIAGVFCARQYDLNFRCVSAHHRPRIFRRFRRRCRRCFVFCRLHRHVFRMRFCSAGTTSSAA